MQSKQTAYYCKVYIRLGVLYFIRGQTHEDSISYTHHTDVHLPIKQLHFQTCSLDSTRFEAREYAEFEESIENFSIFR